LGVKQSRSKKKMKKKSYEQRDIKKKVSLQANE